LRHETMLRTEFVLPICTISKKENISRRLIGWAAQNTAEASSRFFLVRLGAWLLWLMFG
jgi:hypothetical protein